MSDNASVSDVWRSVSAGDRPGGRGGLLDV